MNEKINIKELASFLSEEMNLTKKEAENFLRELLLVVYEGLMKDDSVKIKDLGTFKITEVNARESVNVRTGKRVTIPGHRKVSFSPDKKLSEQVNKPYEHLETTEIENYPEDNKEPEVLKEVLEKPEQTDLKIKQEVKEYRYPPLASEYKKPLEKKHFFIRHPLLTSLIFVVMFTIIASGVYMLIMQSSISKYQNTLREYANMQIMRKETPSESSIPDSLSSDVIIPEQQAEKKDSISVPEKKEEQIIQKEDLKQRKITVKEGERLTLISLREYGSKVFWVYLYKANQDIIKDPNNVLPGTVIVIPDAKLYKINKDNPESVRIAADLAADILDNPGK